MAEHELHDFGSACLSPAFGEDWNTTSNPHYQKALPSVQMQMKDMGLVCPTWSPVEQRSISLCAILMNEAVSKPFLKIQKGDFHHSFRHSLAFGDLEGFDYDAHQSAAELCNANDGAVAAPVLAIVVMRFRMHCDSVWPLAVRFQPAHTHFSFTSIRLALFEESAKVYMYWLIELISTQEHDDDLDDVLAMMREHWFGTSVVPQQSLEMRSNYLSGGTKKNLILSFMDSPSCLFLSGIANLLNMKNEEQSSGAAKRRKRLCRFDLYLKTVKALGFEFEKPLAEKKITMKDAKKATSEEEKQGIYARVGFNYLAAGESPIRVGLMMPGVRPESAIGSPMDGVREILQTLRDNLKDL